MARLLIAWVKTTLSLFKDERIKAKNQPNLRLVFYMGCILKALKIKRTKYQELRMLSELKMLSRLKVSSLKA